MSPEELDDARAEEAYRQWGSKNWSPDDVSAVANIAARLAREGWTPPEPVDPDILAFREWAAGQWPPAANYLYQRGLADNGREAQAYLAGARMAAERIKELEAALAKANEPEWFYRADDAVPEHSLEDAIEEFCDYLEPGWHFVEIDTARPCKTIRGVVHILTDEEIEARGDDEPWVFTPCATEAEARALLKEGDQ